MVYGFSPPTRGELRVFGMDVTRDWRRIKTRIGVCQQDNTLDPDLTVAQNLVVFAGYFGMPRRARPGDRAGELLRVHRADQPARRPGRATSPAA